MTIPPERKILLVDDDESLRRALARTMRLAGYAVESFDSADRVVASGVDCGAACLVLDINLPGTSGVDFRLALAAAGQEPPTVFITALDRHDAEAALAPLHSPIVLFKPFDNDELLAALRRARDAARQATARGCAE